MKRLDLSIRTLILVAAGSGVLLAQSPAPVEEPPLSWRQALRQSPEWHASPEAIRIAEQVLLYQHDNGGWAKDIDMALPRQTSGARTRPNILFVFADDWGRHASVYARIDGPGTVNDLLHTPHFDRVADEGVLFRTAFVSAPSCTPCRSALLSGQHFWRTGRGAILRGAVWDGSQPSFALLLRDAGYHLGKSYKVWSPGTPVDAPYGGQQHAYESAGRRINQFSQHVTRLVAQGQDLTAAKEALYAEVTANFDAFLAARQPGQPFCFWFGPTQVHRSWVRGSGKALWGLDPDQLKGRMPPFLPDVPEVREDLADYFGEIQSLDATLGLLLARLEAIGELDNTFAAATRILTQREGEAPPNRLWTGRAQLTVQVRRPAERDRALPDRQGRMGRIAALAVSILTT